MAKDVGVMEKSSEETAIPIRNLPVDVIEDILSRLPVKSLLRFRCVCKPWCALIKDPDFVKMHLSRSIASNSNLILIFEDYPEIVKISRRRTVGSNSNLTRLVLKDSSFLYSVDLDACEQQVAVELDHPLKCSEFSTKIAIEGSCNGLLCISDKKKDIKEDIFLWNPSIRRHQKLPITPIEFPRGPNIFRRIVYGLGYDPITDDYKVVRVVQFSGDDYYCCDYSGDDCYCRDSEVMVYSLSTNSWRRVGDMPFHLSYEHKYGVLANSALHWVANRKTGPDTFSSFIISFDLKDEEYREVPMPDFVDDTDDTIEMNVAVFGGQLCLVCNFFLSLVEVWVMEDYGVGDSWAKLLSMEPPLKSRSVEYLRPICYSKNGEVILEKDSEVLMLYDPRRECARDLRICGVPHDIKTEAYVGSLIPLNAKDGTEQAKRKKQAEGE